MATKARSQSLLLISLLWGIPALVKDQPLLQVQAKESASFPSMLCCLPGQLIELLYQTSQEQRVIGLLLSQREKRRTCKKGLEVSHFLISSSYPASHPTPKQPGETYRLQGQCDSLLRRALGKS